MSPSSWLYAADKASLGMTQALHNRVFRADYPVWTLNSFCPWQRVCRRAGRFDAGQAEGSSSWGLSRKSCVRKTELVVHRGPKGSMCPTRLVEIRFCGLLISRNIVRVSRVNQAINESIFRKVDGRITHARSSGATLTSVTRESVGGQPTPGRHSL